MKTSTEGINIIFRCIVGSHAYGTNVEGSDRDEKFIYLQDPEDVLNRGYREQETINKDCVGYELRRFLELACGANPTVLEMLFIPEDCILYKHPVMDFLIENRDKLLSKSCKWSYGGYAMDQIKKARGLNKLMNWEKEATERKTLLDFCYIYMTRQNHVAENGKEFRIGTTVPIKEWLKANNYNQKYCGLTSIPHVRYGYNMYYDHLGYKSENPKFKDQVVLNFKGIVQNEDESNSVTLSEVPEYYSRSMEGILIVNHDEFSVHCKRYKQYQEWLKNRNTQRYVDVNNHGQKIDGKNLLHCIRLLETGLEIAETGSLKVRRPNAEYLINIRKGKYNLDTILEEAEEKIERLELAFSKSNLPDKADRGFFMKLMPQIRNDFKYGYGNFSEGHK